MSEVTRILHAIDQGDPHAAAQLLPLVYDALRELAAEKMVQEQPGQTLEATALVHEAYVRLVDTARAQDWNSRGHFFAAAAEAMRRILVENARRKRSVKHGGARQRLDLDAAVSLVAEPADELLAEVETLRDHVGYVMALAYSPDGQILATASGNRYRGEVQLWDTASFGTKR